jgi:hypothetical protein
MRRLLRGNYRKRVAASVRGLRVAALEAADIEMQMRGMGRVRFGREHDIEMAAGGDSDLYHIVIHRAFAF